MSKKPSKESSEALARETHQFLKIQLVTLCSRWHEYKTLFGYSKERVELLNECAGGFFHTVQHAILQQIELSIVRLIDPANQSRNENMTFSRLVDLAEIVLQEAQYLHLKHKLEVAHQCSSRLKIRRNKAVAHLDVQAIQSEDEIVFEWPRIEEVDSSIEVLVDLANDYEQMSGLPIMSYELLEPLAGSKAIIDHLENSLRLKELVSDGTLNLELAYPKRFCSKYSQTTR